MREVDRSLLRRLLAAPYFEVNDDEFAASDGEVYLHLLSPLSDTEQAAILRALEDE